jgi:hypothetical protein
MSFCGAGTPGPQKMVNRITVVGEGALRTSGRIVMTLAAAPTDFEGLFDASGALWPEGARSRVEATSPSAAPARRARRRW